MINVLLLIIVGLFAGSFSGFLGIGGGLIMVPALAYLLKSQHAAQGTSLAVMLPPITLLACMSYYKAGHLDLKVTLYVCCGFFIGSYFGGKLAVLTNEDILRKCFAIFLIVFAVYMFFKKS